IHAAGVLDDGLFAQQTPERFQAVMAPKVIGAWNLHLLTQSAGLDWFVLVSSIAGTLGSSGQSAYAAANCYLDALAAARRARGLVASSIAFGPLSERGLAANLDSRAQTRLSRQGFQFLTLQEASDQLLRSLQGGGENLAVAAIDLRKLSQSSRAQVPPLWRALLRSPARSALRGAEVGPPSTFVKRLEALPREEQLALTTEIVRAEVARVLSLASPVAVPLEKPLKELGLDSLMALELRNGLSRRTSITLPAAVLVQQPSVRSVSEYITASALGDAGSAPGSSVVVKSAASVPFEMDATLDEEIRPPTATQAGAAPASDARSVLLTGATGFLGAYLLAELLREPGTHIHCLVRARDAAAGRARVVENLRQYGLWNDAHGSRVHVLIGDLTQPRLGLDASTFAELAEGVDAIYNNGAVLGFVADYPDLKASHVDATREVLRLASIGVAKFVHHVSSAVVFDSSAYRGQELPESTLPVETRGLQLGYSQCKWVSENLIWKAAARGFPVTVYRPAFIAGASTTGAWNTADFLCRTLKTTIELGTIPGDLELDLELSPVDYVSRAIVHLSRQPDSRGRAFHLQHPSGLSFQRLAEILRSCGYGVREVPYWEWIAQIEARPTDPLAAVLPFLAQRLPPDRLTHIERWQRQYRPKLTCMETLRTLGRANIECPAIDARLIGRYLDYLGEIGFIPRKPAKAGAR
ncbi:MAG TPA: thioester reductase domain-containing protein, partial [Polyangiaceae bacterium]|nr:thioester reductase domain-containing protein [Polyangiaceae bacterium]